MLNYCYLNIGLGLHQSERTKEVDREVEIGDVQEAEADLEILLYD